MDFFGASEVQITDSQIGQVTSAQIQSFLTRLKVEGKSISTRRRRLSALRRFFDWAMNHRELDRNPARACEVEPPQSSSASSTSIGNLSVLSKPEVERLIQATQDAGGAAARDRGLILTILFAALRRAEVAAMNVEHLRPLGRHWVIDLPSGSSWASAYVKVPDTVVEAIDAVQSRYDIKQGALWRSLSNRNRGERLTPDAIYKVIRRTGDTADLPDVNPEVLRQTGLYLAMKSGATMQQVQLHARLKSAASVERYADADGQPQRLGENTPDFIDLNIPDLGEST
jgi:integrase/recombinase XerD